jgi:photosystem II stability/assembly factor-like uncharacterized protein
MARTSDAGRTWIQASAPPATVGSVAYPLQAFSVRFANRVDGWVYTTNPSRLWSTHDGGTSWHPVVLPGLTPEASILGMEAAGGRVYVAIVPDNVTVHLEVSPVASGAWSDTGVGVPAGAGPVPSAQLVLQQSRGWLLQNDRTVVGGFQLNAAGRWTAWTPPCRTANGSAALTASSPSNLAAVCSEGEWGPARNLPAGAGTASPSTWLFQSSDGGASFRAVGPVPLAPGAQQVAGSPAPSTVVVGGSRPALYATFDGGHTWQTVYQGADGSSWSYLGFTTLTQGVAITSTPSGRAAMLMTRDGGHSWAPVSFVGPG